MKIASVMWTPQVNIATIQCECGNRFKQRTDRSQVKCAKCGRHTNIQSIREKFLNRVRGKRL